MVLRFVMLLLLGLIVGVLARWPLPRGDPTGWIAPIGFGIAGSFVGGTIASALYQNAGPIVFVFAVLSAVTLVLVYRAIARRNVLV